MRKQRTKEEQINRKAIKEGEKAEAWKRVQEIKADEAMRKRLRDERLQAPDKLALMDIVGENDGDQLSNMHKHDDGFCFKN